MAVNDNKPQVTGWVGWVYFAGFMMLILGMFQVIVGLTALLNDKFFVVTPSHILAFDLTQWGWIQLIYGIVVLIAGTSLFSGHTWARIIAVLLAAGNLIMQFGFVSSYPIWSVTMMIIDVFVIYALTVHGGELKNIDE